MAPYYPITVCRSDAVSSYIHNGVSTLNKPKPKDLDHTPDEKGKVSVFTEVPEDHPRALQWRRKLAGMLMEVLKAEQKGKEFVLKEFPKGYVLWEHAKYSVDPKNKAEKSHAIGGTDRSDAFLFGHPDGRNRKFRSPQEFFPHLLWLATDTEGNPLNCSCKNCNPDKRNGGGDDDDDGKDDKNLLTQVKGGDGSSSGGNIVKTATPVPATKPVPLPQPFSNNLRPVITERIYDSEAGGPFLYRPGELAWFNKGQAWGLAVICMRKAAQPPQYLLQPLSHPLRTLPQVIKEQTLMRPWLAWSVPNTTHERISKMTFDTVPWDQVVAGQLGTGDAEVDGSILAAKAVDASYTLFDRIEAPAAAPSQSSFGGIFLGGEKIWVGEPIRLKVANDDTVVMVLRQIVEMMAQVPMNSTATLVGDIYQFTEMPSPYTDRRSWPSQDLPARMVADLRFRNEVADDAHRGIWYEWRLLEPAARRGLQDIKGRWYETRALMPVLRTAEQAQEEIRLGNTSDTSTWMNGRGDSTIGLPVKRNSRLEALGGAVPRGLLISRGLDGPESENVFPGEQSQAVPVNQFGGQSFFNGELSH